jgi:acyl transferase domain-containing protein/phosphopantetheinyl transferase
MQREAQPTGRASAMTPGLCDIAIIGMAARFARAPDLSTYWENILAKVDAVSDASDRWSTPFFDPASSDNDRIYTRKGGFLGDSVEFDPTEFGVMPATVAAGDADHFLALQATTAALADAGYSDRPFDRENTGVILGHGTYVNRGYNTLLQHGQIVDQTLALLCELHPELDDASTAALRRALKESLPSFSSTTVPSLVPNVITGRIANRLDLRGPNYIVDAACASSLVAVELSIRELLTGRCSMMLTGGIHSSTPPQLYMMFCQLNALSRGRLRPFDRAAGGTLLGEGLGVLVLKRRVDAEHAGDRIYALIQATGTASDGRALGLLTPRKEGQELALRRAYRDSGIDPATVGLVEAHGTGTPVGDQTEVECLRAIYPAGAGAAPRALGSVKSMVGHCISAAGAAGLIKTALALHDRILPPTLCEAANPDLSLAEASFYVNTETRPWITDPSRTPRRAAVNAFGFGGINAHVVLEEYRGAGEQAPRLALRRWPTELLILSASDRRELAARLRQIADVLANDPSIPLCVLARWLAMQARGDVRLAMVCSDVPALQATLVSVLDVLEGSPSTPPRRRDVYYGERRPAAADPIAFLYPGEGSQYRNMLSDLCVSMPSVRAWFDLLDEVFRDTGDGPPSRAIFPPPTCLSGSDERRLDAQLFAFDTGSGAVFVASMAVHELLDACGVGPVAMVGHSTGEGTALVASGVVRHRGRHDLIESMRRFYCTCRELDRSGQIKKGQMISVGGIDDAALTHILEAGAERALVALDNCPNQKILFCEADNADALVTRIQRGGGLCAAIPLDRAYHTAHFAGLSDVLRALYDDMEIRIDSLPVYSCVTTERFPRDAAAIRELATRQWSSTVRFRETVLRLYGQGIRTFVEVGPGNLLTSFVRDTLGRRKHLTIPSAPQGRSAVSHIQRLLAQLLVSGVEVNLAPLFAHRDVPVRDLPADIICAAHRQGRSRLDLIMPCMTATPEVKERIKGGLANGVAAPVAPERLRTAAPQPADDLAAACVPDQRDPRFLALRGHFRLMQDFLDCQMQVMGAASVRAVDAPAARARNGSPAAKPPPSSETAAEFARAWPLLGAVLEHSHGRLCCERRFDVASDRWLLDHTLGGASGGTDDAYALPIVPFTMSMELLAEAARFLTGSDRQVVELREVRAHRWLALDRGLGSVVIDANLVRSPDPDQREVEVRVHSKAEDAREQQAALAFEGTVVLAPRPASAPPPALAPLQDPAPSHYTEAMLYGALQEGQERYAPMFHGPGFRVVKAVLGWNRRGIEGLIEINDKSAFFRGVEHPLFQLDPVLLDAAGQLLGYWVAERFGVDLTFFPFYLGAYRQYGSVLRVGQQIVCRAAIRLAEEAASPDGPRFEFLDDAGRVIAGRAAHGPVDQGVPDVFDHCRLTPGSAWLEARFEFLDEGGRILASMDGWKDRYFSVPHRHYLFHLRPGTGSFSSPWRPARHGEVCRRIDPAPQPYLEEGWQIWKRALALLVLGTRERASWHALPATGRRRTEWLLGRVAAKEAVREWLRQHRGRDLRAIDIEIAHGTRGEPLVRIPTLPEPDMGPGVSISHSRGVVAAIAFDRTDPLGIDIECLRPVDPDELTSAFGESELQLIGTQTGARRDQMLLALWCAKEAASKVEGAGLEGAPRNWRVEAYAPDGARARVRCGADRYAIILDVSAGVVRAIAAREQRADGMSASWETEIQPRNDGESGTLTVGVSDAGAPS